MKKLVIALAAILVSGAAYGQDLSLGGSLRLNSTATSTSTCNSKACLLTTPALSSGTPTEYSITITNTQSASGDVAICSVIGGTNTGGQPLCQAIPGDGSVAVTIANSGGTVFNGTVQFLVWLLKP